MSQASEIFAYWSKRHPSDYLTPHPGLEVWREVEKRLAEGATVERLKKAIDGIHLDDWKDRPKHLTLLNAVKSPEAVAKFVALADSPPKKKPPAEDPNDHETWGSAYRDFVPDEV